MFARGKGEERGMGKGKKRLRRGVLEAHSKIFDQSGNKREMSLVLPTQNRFSKGIVAVCRSCGTFSRFGLAFT